MSAPPMNAFEPAPVTTTARSVSSALSFSTWRVKSSNKALPTTFNLRWLSTVRRATPRASRANRIMYAPSIVILKSAGGYRMPNARSGRLRHYLLAPLFIVVCSMGAGFLNSDSAVAATADDDVSQSMRSFTRIYDLVERNSADPVDADKAIYDGAIPGMLHTLDPHSNFFDPKAYAQMKEDQ